VLPFADALATGPACDGCILVVRYGKTRADHVRRAGEALAGVRVPLLGSVLTMTPGGRDRGYGYRRYRYTPDDPQRREMLAEDAAPSPAVLP